MTTRRWMIAVASVAAVMALVIAQNDWWLSMPRRVAERRARAVEHLRLARGLPDGVNRLDFTDLRPPDPRAEYHRKMADKWSRASRRPWTIVAPDPPPPE